jgi:hypothetical protein
MLSMVFGSRTQRADTLADGDAQTTYAAAPESFPGYKGVSYSQYNY